MKIVSNNKALSETALALALTPADIGYSQNAVTALREDSNVPARIRQIKSDALFALSVDVMKTVRVGETAIAQQSKLLGIVLKNKLYLTENYDSFRDFCENTYGLNPGTAYMRAKVGNTIMSNPDIPDEFKAMPVSTLERVANLSGEQIKAAINDGKITPDMSQFEVRDVVKNIKAESASTKPQKAKTTYPLVVEMFLNGEWSIINSKLQSEYNLKLVSTQLTGPEWTGAYAKFPGETDKGQLDGLFESTDGAWYHLRITKAVQPAKTDKAAKTLIEISADEYRALVEKVIAGEMNMAELANTFTVKQS